VSHDEVVIDSYLVACFEAEFGKNAPDVTGSACDEDIHAPGNDTSTRKYCKKAAFRIALYFG
jgi:hypothetical protein